jgi:hypothetical protein
MAGMRDALTELGRELVHGRFLQREPLALPLRGISLRLIDGFELVLATSSS